MEKIETLQDIYKRKFDSNPSYIDGMGHFNIFHLEPYVEGKPTTIPYRRRDFFKIMLVKGNGIVHYADNVVEIKNYALTFSNPQIPYKWEQLNKIHEGVYCIFNQQLFHHFGQLTQYEVFQPSGNHVFELSEEQLKLVEDIYQRMEKELNSEYKYKYDVIRNQIFELLHFALKVQPPSRQPANIVNASNRISGLFLELLERQFPIDDQHPVVKFRSPSEFAEQLNIHVNHLNRAIRETLEKTTTQVIAARLLQEAKVLLRHSKWSIAEVAYSLGFSEATHFNNFFKKHAGESPTHFRNV